MVGLAARCVKLYGSSRRDDVMTQGSESMGERTWSSRMVFVMAAIGAAVGLGNIWKFPYEAGVSGGGAFVLLYLLCVLLVAIPILVAELLVGRMGAKSPPIAMRNVAISQGHSPKWSFVGWMGIIVSFIVISFYIVIAGWALTYLVQAPTGYAGDPGENFAALLASPGRLMLGQVAVLLISLVIVVGGLRAGIERAVKCLMPALFLMLIVMIVVAAILGDFWAGASFLFAVEFEKITREVVLEAVGQAFFSVGLAAGIMMVYGAYMPKQMSIPKNALIIGIADSMVAFLAGLMIFPLVFGFGLDPGQGPGLIFVSLPHAFQSMPAGGLVGAIFFALLTFAAITTIIAAIEPMVAYVEDQFAMPRLRICLILGAGVWLLGLATVLSFNHWSEVKPLGGFETFKSHTIFDLLDYGVTNVLMPLGGVFIAVFVGWRIKQDVLQAELGEFVGRGFWLWLQLIRYLAPIAILLVFWTNLT